MIELFVRAANIHAVSVETMATATAQNYAENELARSSKRRLKSEEWLKSEE